MEKSRFWTIFGFKIAILKSSRGPWPSQDPPWINKKSTKNCLLEGIGTPEPPRPQKDPRKGVAHNSPIWEGFCGHVGCKNLKKSVLKASKTISTSTSIFHRFWCCSDFILGNFEEPCWPPESAKNQYLCWTASIVNIFTGPSEEFKFQGSVVSQNRSQIYQRYPKII